MTRPPITPPGKGWHVPRRCQTEQRFLVSADGDTVIADCSTGVVGNRRKVSLEEQEANATAIAALHDLFDELEGMETYLEDGMRNPDNLGAFCGTMLLEVRAAMVKAGYKP